MQVTTIPTVIAALLIAVVTLGAALTSATPAGAAPSTRYVSSTGSDSGTCLSSVSPCATVSYAADQANSGDVIDVSGTIDDNVSINTPVTITQWAGQSPAVLDGNDAGLPLYVGPGQTATIDHLTVTGGQDPLNGGGILVNSGTLTVDSSTISGNTATAPFAGLGAAGGGIFNNNGTLTINNSTISGNTADFNSGGGGNAAGGGIFENGGTLSINDSTISGNVAASGGPGNEIYFNGGSDTLAGDILATAGGAPASGECSGSTPTDDGYNVDDDGSCGFTGTGSVSSSSTIDNYLGPLQDNGGQTDTIALLPGSTSSPNPAQGVIPATFTAPGQSTPVCTQADQRGVLRGRPCDMGSYSLSIVLYALPDGTGAAPCTTESLTPSAVCSLETAIAEVNANGDGVINLESPSGNSTYTGVGDGGVNETVSAPVTLQPDANAGFDSATPTFDGETNGIVLDISGNYDVTITGVTIENGVAPFGRHGGAIFNGGSGTLQVTDSLLTANSGGGGGAISNSDGGTLIVVDSSFTNNNSDGGGAIDNATDDTGTGTLTITGSTFSDNHANNFSGGAILNGYGSGSDGDATISDSTFSGNTAFYDDGGAIDSGDNDGSGSLTISHTTFVGNSLGDIRNGTAGTVISTANVFADSCEQDPGETWTDNGYNVGSDSSCFNAGTGDDDSAGSALSSLLGPLADNGGPTQTVSLLSGNPAIGIVPDPTSGLCPVVTDQRGDASQPGVACDAGAVQLLSAQSIGSVSSPPAHPVAGGATYRPAATASSGLAVTITVDPSTSSECTMAGGVVHFTASGTCELDFNQVGDATWAAAPVVNQSFAVGQGTQTIGSLSPAPAHAVVAGLTYRPTATASSGLAVTITVDPSTSSTCSMAGGAVSFHHTGTCKLDFNQVGNISWAAAPVVNQSFAVGQGTQTIGSLSPAPVDAVAGKSSYRPSASSSSGLPVVISVSPSTLAVCSMSGAGVVTFVRAGTCALDFNQAGDATWKPAVPVHQSFTVHPAPVKPPKSSGYRLVASDGGLFSYNEPFLGSMGGHHLNRPVVGMAADPLTGGYDEVASDGGIFAFHAPFYGSMGAQHLNAPIVGMAFDAKTGGYYEVAADGGIFAFHAPFDGSMGGHHLDSPIVGMAFDAKTGGYYEVAADGGIFAFGAPFQGSTGGKPLVSPMVGMAFDAKTGGYYEVAANGGVFGFNAPLHGSAATLTLNKPVVGMAVNTVTGGYYEVAANGSVFAFDAPFKGSAGNLTLNQPVVGMTFG